MSHRRKVPEDLMGSILGEGSGASPNERPSSKPRRSQSADRETVSRSSGGGGAVSWEDHPERIGITFNLSKQVSTEVEKLRLELERDISPSKSEITEVALRIALEDVRERGWESELIRRLSERHALQTASTTDEATLTVRRSVDESGFIVETTYDEEGEIVDEDVVASVADLPVEGEYVDEQGRLVSLARDELGNTFEQIMDEALNPLETRLIPGADWEAR
ncbi:MAG TPA: hypothetical protein VK902_22415 [Rubrobacter sp.]|nr:hypothetical protein [Rubrobacter sp.]